MSTKKRKLAQEPTSPSDKIEYQYTPSTPLTIRSPGNIGSMMKPIRNYDPYTPICNPKNLSVGYVIVHGYMYNMNCEDKNDFAGISENASMFLHMYKYTEKEKTTYIQTQVEKYVPFWVRIPQGGENIFTFSQKM